MSVAFCKGASSIPVFDVETTRQKLTICLMFVDVDTKVLGYVDVAFPNLSKTIAING